MTRLVALLAMSALLAGCDLSMTQQNKYGTDTPASLWSDGTSARPLPAHVVAQGDLARDEAAKNPPPVTPALLARGRQRFGIYCAPCHGLAGDGDGIIVHRGFPAPPSFHGAKLLAAPASHFFDVITDGYGAMYPYTDRVDPHDRWAIIAYIRALQLQRHATIALAPEAGQKLP
jgi:mono/diheme cytochrome c family protein